MLELIKNLVGTAAYGAIAYFLMLQLNRGWAKMIKFLVVIMMITQVLDAWNNALQPVWDFFSALTEFLKTVTRWLKKLPFVGGD